MDVSAFDLEEMDEEEREELEAMLYAQVHHAPPDATEVVEPLPPEPTLPPPEPGAVKIQQIKRSASVSVELGALTNGFDHSPPPSVKKETESETAVGSYLPIPAVRNISAGTGSSQQVRGGTTRADVESSSQPEGGIIVPESSMDVKPVLTGPMIPPSTNSGGSTSLADVSAATPSSTALTEPSQSSLSAQLLQAPVPAALSPYLPAGALKRPLSPSSSDEGEPETKTAALAAGERRRRRRRRLRHPTEPVHVHGSSSGSSTDEYVMEAGGIRPFSAIKTDPDGKISPEVVAIDDSLSPVPEVISLGDGDSRSPSPKPSTSATTARPASVASTSSSSSSSSSSESSSADVQTAGKRPPAVGMVLPKTLPQRRPRTSSDLSSSDDSDGGAALVADCDITMNVRGAWPSPAAVGGARRTEATTEEELMDDGRPGLPTPACQRVLASASQLTAAERRLLGPLCLSRPCFKWSDQQRDGYTMPRDYGPEDVDGIQATMSERGWDIPAHYLQSSAGKRSAKARYYSNLQKNRCRRCDDVGHVMAACPLPPVCHLCGERGHRAEHRCKNMFCYMCGRRDHLAQRCPRHVKPVFCALCKSSGHTSEQCSDRWRRYHATTSPGPVVRPPPSLENRPSRRVFCWECGERGHHGHHCRNERYTAAASLSQHVISYTETFCPSRDVPSIVATPAQMDAVFAPKRRRRLEQETGASLTYDQVGDKSWLINISGSLKSARTAHEHVQDILHGKKRPRPRPSSAPASPVHPTRPEGAHSLPVSPEPPLEPEIADGAAERKKATKERRRLQKEAREAERKKKRQAEAARQAQAEARQAQAEARQAQAEAARQARQARTGPAPPVIDIDARPGDVVDVDSRSGDDCMELPPEDVLVLDEWPAPAPAPAVAADVDTVTLESDGEDLSAGLEPGPDLEVLAVAGQNWDLRLLLNGSVTPNAIRQQYVGKPAGKLSKGQRARLNKKRRKAQMTQGAEEEVTPVVIPPRPSTSSPAPSGTSHTPTPSTSQEPANLTVKGAKKKQLQLKKQRLAMEMSRVERVLATLDPKLMTRLSPGRDIELEGRDHGARSVSTTQPLINAGVRVQITNNASKLAKKKRVVTVKPAGIGLVLGGDQAGMAGKAMMGKKKRKKGKRLVAGAGGAVQQNGGSGRCDV